MIGKGWATITAGVPPAMAIASVDTVTHSPTIWLVLGYPFEAAGMCAALFGAFMARIWIGAATAIRKEHRWSIDVPVTGMVLATAAASVVWLRPEPFAALMMGAGLGVLGEGIFKVAEQYLPKGLSRADTRHSEEKET